jgi:hypothetical protein
VSWVSDLKDYFNKQMQNEEFRKEYEKVAKELKKLTHIDTLTVGEFFSSLRSLSFTRDKAFNLAKNTTIDNKESEECLLIYNRAKELLEKYNNCNINNTSLMVDYYKNELLLYLDFEILRSKLKKCI